MGVDYVDVELAFAIMDANVSAVKADDVAYLADNREILKSACVDNNLSPVSVGWFAAL